ncbi:MAG: hypothetical protein M3364_02190, partial [Actinomycetota bacterium]|nr:hypothetical protein [Actinomycetota bacterium]
MPRSRSTSRRTLTRIVLFALPGWALYALRRDGAEHNVEQVAEASFAVGLPVADEAKPVEHARTRARGGKQRFATSLAFATLFFAGAAFSAGADDAIEAMESDTAAACYTASADSEPAACPDAFADESGSQPADEPTDEPAQKPTETEPAPERGSDEPVTGEEPSTDDATTEPTEGGEAEGTTDEPADREATDNGSEGASSGQSPRDEARTENAEPAGTPVVDQQPAVQAEETADLDPEVAAFELATVLLHRALPDPIRPAERLAPAFARNLRAESKRARVDWAMVLGVLRADGELGRVPATRRELRSVARQLHRLLQGREERQALLAYHGRTAFADRAMALTRYNRAVGLRPLVTGFEAAKVQIALRVLSDSRLDIYSAGRGDIAAGRINVRVLVLMRYLAEAYGSVRVSSL